PNDASTLEVESVMLYDHDVSAMTDDVVSVKRTWYLQDGIAPLDVPITVPMMEEETENLLLYPTWDTLPDGSIYSVTKDDTVLYNGQPTCRFECAIHNGNIGMTFATKRQEATAGTVFTWSFVARGVG